MPRIGILLALLTIFPLSLPASATDLLSMAHKAGFNRCDSAILEEFKGLSENGEGVASTGYFNNRSFSVMATWGKDKDSIWKNTTFIKFGRRCLAYSLVGSTFPTDCTSFKSENPQWQEIRKAADFTWTQNQGGINALLKDLPSGGCSVTYRIHQAYTIDPLPRPSQKAEKPDKENKDTGSG
ncbi:hypothetical protein [Endozoicomonas sp. Mp262]|uniref:hypothetical protein n=1 Tax=Endozoicomonas sp. Mp262 TaxID=2919499 RepID=UPI0021DB32BB